MDRIKIIGLFSLACAILIVGVAVFSPQASRSSGQPGTSLEPATSIAATTKAIPTTVNAITNTPAPADTGNGSCIITISGSKYDVTSLQMSHSGGNVFVCGTDQTDVFFSHHNQRFLQNQMQMFLIP